MTPTSIRIALLGFSDFERTSLTTCFRLAAERQPHYELVYTLTDADYLVADADHTPSVQLIVVTERMAETVFIGSHAPEGAAGSMRRPIDALHVMRALDALAHTSGRVPLPVQQARPADDPESGVIVQSMLHMPAAPAAAAAPAFSTPPASPDLAPRHAKSGFDEPRRVAAPVAAPAPAARTAAPRVASRSALATPRRQPPVLPHSALGNAPPTGFVGPPAPARALLVDDSAIALRFLASRLAPWSLRTDTVSTSGQALELLAQRSYDLIFLDLELGPGSELDGLALCRHIKRHEFARQAYVVMVSAHHSEIDRARGSLAGCDAYLSKPLKESELATLLHRQGMVPPEGAPVRLPATGGVWPAA